MGQIRSLCHQKSSPTQAKCHLAKGNPTMVAFLQTSFPNAMHNGVYAGNRTKHPESFGPKNDGKLKQLKLKFESFGPPNAGGGPSIRNRLGNR